MMIINSMRPDWRFGRSLGEAADDGRFEGGNAVQGVGEALRF